MEKIKLEEETAKEVINQWKKESGEQSMETLPVFLNHLVNDYEHDYGTIVRAITAGMMATFSAINKSDQGGVSGFQASFIGWSMVDEFLHTGSCGAMLVKFEDMLYPQYEEKFTRNEISKKLWKRLQEEANLKLVDAAVSPDMQNTKVVDHWKSIVAGVVPFGYTVKEEEE